MESARLVGLASLIAIFRPALPPGRAWTESVLIQTQLYIRNEVNTVEDSDALMRIA
jgi:hypothetical protein